VGLEAEPFSTFILRFWQSSENDVPAWRGEVHHIQSGERLAFVDEAALLRFLHQWIISRVRAPADGEHQ
jgi:hypothetical protein